MVEWLQRVLQQRSLRKGGVVLHSQPDLERRQLPELVGPRPRAAGMLLRLEAQNVALNHVVTDVFTNPRIGPTQEPLQRLAIRHEARAIEGVEGGLLAAPE